MKIIELKCWPLYYNALNSNRKRFEFRKNDRDFMVDDLLHIQEFYPDKKTYSGRSCLFRIDYILKGDTALPLPPLGDYVIMSISKVNV